LQLHLIEQMLNPLRRLPKPVVFDLGDRELQMCRQRRPQRVDASGVVTAGLSHAEPTRGEPPVKLPQRQRQPVASDASVALD
jgi:hypothetical protein